MDLMTYCLSNHIIPCVGYQHFGIISIEGQSNQDIHTMLPHLGSGFAALLPRMLKSGSRAAVPAETFGNEPSMKAKYLVLAMAKYPK